MKYKFWRLYMKNVGAVGVKISPLPLKRHIAYTTACCYRTSRDQSESNSVEGQMLTSWHASPCSCTESVCPRCEKHTYGKQSCHRHHRLLLSTASRQLIHSMIASRGSVLSPGQSSLPHTEHCCHASLSVYLINRRECRVLTPLGYCMIVILNKQASLNISGLRQNHTKTLWQGAGRGDVRSAEKLVWKRPSFRFWKT